MEIIGKLTGIELGNDNSLVSAEHFGGIRGERVDVAEMCEIHFHTLAAKLVCGGAEMSVCAAPSEQEGVGIT